MQVATQDDPDPPKRGARRWSAALAATLLLVAAALPISGPAFAQFGLHLGGHSSGGGWGKRGGYGPWGMAGRQPHSTRPPTVPYPGRPYPKPWPTKPYPVQPSYPVKPSWPGKGGVYGQGGWGRPGYPAGMHRPYPRPYPLPWGARHGDPVRPMPYRPPVVVEDDPPRYRPRRPIVVAQPPAARPLRLAPLRPVRPARAAPPASPPAGRRPPPPRPVPSAPAPVIASDGPYVDREVLVELAGTQPAGAIERIAARHGLTRLDSAELTLAGTTAHRLRVNGRRSVDSAVAALGRDSGVALAQRNHLYRLAVDRGQAYYPLSASQYAAAKLHLAEAHRLATGEGVTVAVIDSGVDTSHPELQGAIGASENTLSSEASPDRHGTAIAGAIAARGQLRGVAPGTRILAIRAFSPATGRAQAEGTSWDIVRAVDLAGKAGAQVVNMSFAGPADRLMSRELAGGLQRGIVFVAAAGNGGPAAPPAYPAAEPGVIAVTATDLQDRLYESANRGPYVAFAAPGVDVLVASPQAGYDTSTGTSVAAAHVSGIVALMLERYRGMSPAAIRAALAARARDLGPPGPDPEFGAGLVDAYAALGGPEAPAASAAPSPMAAAAPAEPGGTAPLPDPPAAPENPPPPDREP